MPEPTTGSGFILVAQSGLIVAFDRSAARILGPTGSLELGSAADRLFQEADAIARALVARDGVETLPAGPDADALPMLVTARRLDTAGSFDVLVEVAPSRAADRARAEPDSGAVLEAMAEGVVVQDADGRVVLSNAAAERILGVSAGEMAGRTSHDRRWRMVDEHGAELPGDAAPPMRTLRSGRPVDAFPMGVRRPDGERVWLEVSSRPVPLPGREHPGVMTVFVDVSARRRAEAALREREEQYRLLVERAVDPVFRVDADGIIRYVSPSVEALLGHTPRALIGTRATELLDPRDISPGDPMRARIDAGKAVELRMRRCDGGSEWVEATIRTIRDADGALVEWQGSVRSIADRKRAEERLRQTVQQYRALARSIPGGSVLLLDRDLRCVVAEGPTIDGSGLVGHHVREIFAEHAPDVAVDAARAAVNGQTRRLRHHHPDGRVLDVVLAPVLDGGETAAIVLSIDTTARARLEAQHDALLRVAEAATETTDPSDVLLAVSEQTSLLFGAVGALVTRVGADGVPVIVAAAPSHLAARLPGARVGPTSASWRAAASARAATVCDYDDDDDPIISALRAAGAVGGCAAPILVGGEVWGTIGIASSDPGQLTDEAARQLAHFADIVATTVARSRALDALREIATTDALTGLPNRRAFDEQLAREAARAARDGEPLALLLLDLDRFKDVNDAHGHPTGDRALQQLAEILRREARTSDHVSRIGGEEFAWLLPETDADEAADVAERVRHAVATHPFPAGSRLTISVGVAELHRDAGPAELVRRADGALYRAKEAGRDRVIDARTLVEPPRAPIDAER